MRWRCKCWGWEMAIRRSNWPSSLAGFLFAICIVIPVWSAEGLSTAFADVTADKVPLGVPYFVVGPGLKSLVLKNLGDQPIHVRIEAVMPRASQLRRGANAIPNLAWVDFRPSILDIPPKGERESEIVVTVPAEKKYRKRYYQVMIWSHATPIDQKGITVSAGLLSRLQIKTAL
jgi:hypothetical protein